MAQPRHRFKNRFGKILLGSVLALSLVAAACGGGDDSADGDGDSGDGKPVVGGEITYGLEAGNSGGWCLPEAQLAAAGIEMAKAIYEPLTAINADGEYVPFLAESLEPNEDYTLWTLKVRPGVKFHDGTDLDATVVKNNIDAYRGEYPARSPLLFTFVLDNIKDVTVIDDMTVEISANSTWPSLPAFLNLGGRFGVSAQAQLDDPETCDSNLIGTGPFSLDEWVPNDHLTASKFADYWQKDADGTQLPYLDKITFKPIVEAQARVNALLSGQLQLMHDTNAPQFEELTSEAEADNVKIYDSAEYAEVSYAMLNSAKAPFDNKNARLAFAHAFSQDAYNEVIGLDQYNMASGPFGPGSVGFVEDAGFPEYDTAKAEEFSAKYTEETGEPLKFTMALANSEENLRTGQFIQAELAKVGIEMELQAVEQAALINTALGGEWEVLGWRNHPGGDPDLQRVWWFSESPVNFGGINDAEMDSLMEQGRAEPDAAKRQDIYASLNERFGSEAYNIWYNWSLWYIAMDTNVQGLLGPDLPDGSAPFPGIASGTPVSGLWISQ